MIDMFEYIEDSKACKLRAIAFRQECRDSVTDHDREYLTSAGIDLDACELYKFPATPWTPFLLRGVPTVFDGHGNFILLAPKNLSSSISQQKRKPRRFRKILMCLEDRLSSLIREV